MSAKVFSVGDFIKFIEDSGIPYGSNLSVELDNGHLGLLNRITAYVREGGGYPQVVLEIKVK